MRYQSYLLRLWCETQHSRVIWRASLENIQTRERHGFPELLDLFAFLYLESFTKSRVRPHVQQRTINQPQEERHE